MKQSRQLRSPSRLLRHVNIPLPTPAHRKLLRGGWRLAGTAQPSPAGAALGSVHPAARLPQPRVWPLLVAPEVPVFGPCELLGRPSGTRFVMSKRTEHAKESRHRSNTSWASATSLSRDDHH